MLTEIKKGEFGRGLLIERDGHLNAPSETIGQIREDINTHKEFVIPDRFIVDGVFQRYDAENHNGRIYPKNVLVPEIDRYIRASVSNRSSFGALDHPECLTKDAKVLTENGWKAICDVTTEDMVWTLDEDRRASLQKVERSIESRYDGTLIRIHGDGIDVKVTHNHRFPVFGNHGCSFIGLYSADEMMSRSIQNMDECVIPSFAEFPSEVMDETITMNFGGKEKSISYTDWVDLIGYFCACYYSMYEGKIFFEFSDDGDLDNFMSLMGRVSDEQCEVSDIDDGTYTVIVKDAFLYDMLSEYTDTIPSEFKNLPPSLLKRFCMIFMDINDSSIEEDWAYDIAEILSKCSYPINVIGDETEGFNVSLSKSNDIRLAYEDISFEEIPFNGNVYCLTVPNHTFLVMDENGNVFWSGNSSALSGHDVSHIITELHWEGPTLVGKMELNLSEGFRRHGVLSTSGDHVAQMLINGYLIGVSSRALGNVVQKYGKAYVDDSLEIVAFDVVLQPSTNCAYISADPQDVPKFIAMDRENPIYEGIKKAENLLF